MEFSELIKVRRSTRSYVEGKTISKETIDKIIDAARTAPSGCNAQPSHFIAINDPAKVKIATSHIRIKGSNPFLENASAYIIIIEDLVKLSTFIGDLNHCGVIAQHDCGVSTAYITLAAENLGIQSCIIGSWHQKGLIEAFGLPDNIHIGMIISLGYAADKTVPEKNRLSTKELVKYV